MLKSAAPAFALVVLIAAAASPTAKSASDCGVPGLLSGCTEVEPIAGPGYVTLGGTHTIPGHPGSSSGNAAGGQRETPENCSKASDFYDYFCVTMVDDIADETGVTLSDIAHFVPTDPLDSMEPNGWAVIGLHTNFWATSSTHIVSGQLLGLPAEVRFTPYAWHWDYGDGTTRTASTPGAPWAFLRIPEFDPTATSHVYDTKGDYTIRLWVDYTADYRLSGGSWHPIPGSLQLRANDLHVSTYYAKTVLVDENCLANPAGPGC